MDYAKFIASFKLILKNNDQVLILNESKRGFLDFPGGRANKSEAFLPIKDILEREIAEELGQDIKYEILGPAMQYRRRSSFADATLTTIYEANYLSGQIKLSDEHSKYEWIDPKTYNLKDKKINNEEERQAFENYFKRFK
jgi:8-oxo-dGTP pyrophosphatase MutT (NUDIX family)